MFFSFLTVPHFRYSDVLCVCVCVVLSFFASLWEWEVWFLEKEGRRGEGARVYILASRLFSLSEESPFRPLHNSQIVPGERFFYSSFSPILVIGVYRIFQTTVCLESTFRTKRPTRYL